MSATNTSDTRPGPRPTCRRGVAVFPPAPGNQERANQNDAVALPAADDGFARPVENGATVRSTRIFAGGPHPNYATDGGRSFGVKPVEFYAAQSLTLGDLQGKVSASTSDRFAFNANVGAGSTYGMGSLRVRPDGIAGMNLLGGAVGGGFGVGTFGRGAADVGLGREHTVSDLGNRQDSETSWHTRSGRLLGRGESVSRRRRRRRSQSSFNDRPVRDVEIKDVSSYSLFGSFMPSVPTVMGMFRSDAGLACETRLVVPLVNDKAWKALYRQNGLFEMMRDRCSGARHQDIKVPTLQQPNDIGVGSKLTVLTIANGQLTTFWGIDGARVGVQRIAQRNVNFAVRRNAVDSVRATYSVMNLGGNRWSAGCVLGAQAMTGSFHVNVWNYDVGFDASIPEAEKVYRKFVKGYLPKFLGGTHEKSVAPTWNPTVKGRLEASELDGVAAFINSFNQQRCGTRYESVRNINANYTRRGMALRWYLLPNYFLYPGQVTALSNERVNTDYEEHGSNGNSTWRIQSMGREFVTERGWRGTQVIGTSAMRVWAKNLNSPRSDDVSEEFDEKSDLSEDPEEPSPAAQGLSSTVHLNARFYASRTNSDNINQSFIEPINRALRLKLRTLNYDSVDLERCIEIESSVNDADAIKLTKLKPSRADEFVFSGSTGLPSKTISTFLKTIRKLAGDLGNDQLEAIKACVQRFVREHGMAGFGLVHQLLQRKVDDVSVTTMSDHYQASHKRARSVVFRYRDPLHTKMKLGDLRSRWLDVRQALWEVESGIKVLDGDELISSADRRSLLNGLEADLDDLRAAICTPPDMEPADQRKIVDLLRSAWYRPFTTHAFANHMLDPKGRHQQLVLDACKTSRAAIAQGPLQGNTPSREIRRRFDAARTIVPKLHAAAHLTRTDVYLYDDEKEVVTARLNGIATQIGNSLACSALSAADRNQLRATLKKRLWLTSGDKATLQTLDEVDALAPLVAAGRYTHEQVDAVAWAHAPVLQKARATLAKFQSPMHAGMTGDELRERFGAVEDALRDLGEALASSEADHAPTARRRNLAREQLELHSAALRSCIATNTLIDAQRQELIARVEKRFWKSSLDGRIVTFLSKAEDGEKEANALRALPALHNAKDVGKYLRRYGAIDHRFEQLLKHLKNDVLRPSNRVEQDTQTLTAARERMHINLWERRAAIHEPFEFVEKWWYWPSKLSWWTALGRRVHQALRAVPANYVAREFNRQ